MRIKEHRTNGTTALDSTQSDKEDEFGREQTENDV
jgi:predicted DNA binding CopG/RHH family protein